MSYSHIYGHRRQIQMLKMAVKSGRVSHAYLFYGIDGVGKCKCAIAFAQALLCRDVDDGEGCGICLSCRRIQQGLHPDVLFIGPESGQIRIQAVRSLTESLCVRPVEGNQRVVIISDAERMNLPAANALLKTLEEPAPSTRIVLITSRFGQIPQTVISRCQRVSFGPLSKAEVASYLRDTYKIEEDIALVIAAASGGSISRAVKLLKSEYLLKRDELFETMLEAIQRNSRGTIPFVAYLNREDVDVLESLNILKMCFRDALVFCELGEREMLCFPDREDVAVLLGRRFGIDGLLRCVDILDESLYKLEMNANKTLTLEYTVFRLLSQ
ncbi:MAG: DNA polymerase III subunit delta' [Syntrophales bacterium]|nr:DNA polymerase III subunit delta' [Syntrophales bacterium]